MTARLRKRYGARPLHLLGHLAVFALAAFAFTQMFSGSGVIQLIAWLIGFALLQDLVLIPLYSLIGRGLGRLPGPSINYVRVPAVISGLLLLVYAPLIFGLGAHTLLFYSGHRPAGYLRNWLLISACLFLISGSVYLIRSRRS
jgi:Na+/melibiose symporter-like transporter